MIELSINELIGLCAMALTCGMIFGVGICAVVTRWLAGRERRAMDSFFKKREQWEWRRQERPDITDQRP